MRVRGAGWRGRRWRGGAAPRRPAPIAAARRPLSRLAPNAGHSWSGRARAGANRPPLLRQRRALQPAGRAPTRPTAPPSPARLEDLRELNRKTFEETGEYMSEEEIRAFRTPRWTDRREFQDDD